MNGRTICSALLIIAVLLVPGLSQARWLNPNSGRFQTMDSYEGDQEQPKSLHRYTYAESDPINKVDPSGQITIDVALGSAEAMAIRARHESAAAPTYAMAKGQAIALAEMAGFITVGYLAADFAMERGLV